MMMMMMMIMMMMMMMMMMMTMMMMMMTTTRFVATTGMALPSSREARRRRVCFGGDVTTTTIRNARITLNEVLRYTNMFSLCSQGGVWVAVGGPSPSVGDRDITWQIHRSARAFFFSVA